LTLDRFNLVKQAADSWADELIDFGHRNTLLYFKNSRYTSINLTDADSRGLTALFQGREVRLSDLYPDEDQLIEACARLRSLRRKLVELAEEQGIEAGWVARGLLCVDNPQSHSTAMSLPPLRAPLLLRQLHLKARTAMENDFTLRLSDDVEINPILLYSLEKQYGINADLTGLREKINEVLTRVADPAEQVTATFQEISSALGSRLEVRLEKVIVAGVFSFDKLPMIEDLRSATELLAQHPILAAMAGDQSARQELSAQRALEPLSTDNIRPEDEFLVLDADSSQQDALNAVLSGRHVVIEGPPGTGKSQTIANIIAMMAARGKRVLFVSEKRAAIEAVINRLEKVGLDRLVFDLHRHKLSRRDIAARIAEVLDRASTELPPPPLANLHRDLAKARAEVARHPAELHAQREPWGLSAYEVITRLAGLPPADVSTYNLRASGLRQLNEAAIADVKDKLRSFIAKGGLRVLREETPWARSSVRSMEDVERILAHLDELSAQSLLSTRSQLEALVSRSGFTVPDSLVDWQQLLSFLHDVENTVRFFGGAHIFGPQLEDFQYAVAPRRWRNQYARPLGLWRRFQLRRQLYQMVPPGTRKETLFAQLSRAVAQRDHWHTLTQGRSHPTALQGVQQTLDKLARLRTNLAAIAAEIKIGALDQQPASNVDDTVRRLNEDEETLRRLPELNRLKDELYRLGLERMLADFATRRVDEEEAMLILERAWLTAVFNEMRLRVPYLAHFVGRQHDATVARFRALDAEHVKSAAQRIRHLVAVQLRKARDEHPQQNLLVRQEATRKSRHMPPRRLVAEASDVLLAAFPCWAMSPLIVSRMLPSKQLFDLVIFDEASQVEPHDAVTSIMRGRQLVVAGDSKQLPPTSFFRRLSGDPTQDDEEDESGDQLTDYESILDRVRSLIPDRYTLRWHYRSRDERLIAFSNVEIYNSELVTFPGVQEESPLRLELVDGRVRPGQNGSAPEEVERVVDLILEHARQHPHESLGVITMGQRHADRIEAALRQRRQENDQLDDFLSQERPASERFFIKSIENVQGDERDAVILSIGYAKDATGRLRMYFGPLNQAGGERRLNVAITRARNRMTVVSSFSHFDMDPSVTAKAQHRGPELLRRYLEFVANYGNAMGGRPNYDLELNGLERSVLAALEAEGIKVFPQWGVSDYRIDFALAHPEQPGRMVLAVETDGHRYHSSRSARDRDRLRQNHLENLGWRFHRLWSTDWYANPEQETQRIVKAWQHAIAEADRERTDPAPAKEPTTAAATPTTGAMTSTAAATTTAGTTARAAAAVVTPERGPRPFFIPGRPINAYSDTELIRLFQWLLQDRLQYDRETRIQQAMQELGFKRRGKNIVQRLGYALSIAQRLADQEEN